MIYVDMLQVCLPTHRWRHTKSCHLFADTIKELQQFATRIGLKEEWFQDHPRLPHYDLTRTKRDKAVKYGAKEVDNCFVGQFMQDYVNRQRTKGTENGEENQF